MSVKSREFKKRRNRTIVITIIFAILIFLITTRLSRFMLGSKSSNNQHNHLSKHIAVLDIDGEMSDSSSTSYDHYWIINTIDDLMDNPMNKGIFLRINTPGGSVYYSDELYNKLIEYKKTTKNPVYVYMEDMAASGGYYVSAAADKIYANRNCWTGSIGVTTGTMINVKGLLDKIGIKTVTITSGRNKSMGSSTEDMTDEQRKIMQSLIDESYERFINIVADGRKIDIEKVREIADGRIYTATQAKDLNLVDKICSEEDARELIYKNIKMKNIKYIVLSPPKPSLIDKIDLVKGNKKPYGDIELNEEMSKYNDLLELAKGGNYITVSYICNIRK